MDLLTIGILTAIAAALVVYSLMPRKGDTRAALRRRLAGGRAADDVAAIRDKARASATEQLVKSTAPMLQRLVLPTSNQDQTNLRIRLTNAGYRHAQAQTFFLASKSVLGAVGLIIGVIVGIVGNYQLTALVGAVAFGAGVGFMLPNFWLSMAVSGRQEKIRHGLPDTLDLLVVSVESGLALDAALKRVGEEMAMVHHDLSDEMRIATMESQMGLPRSEALENMARRCGIEEMGSLVSVITQAEKFGTSIAKALRNQGDALRTKRRQRAEERAQKTAVKLMMPLVLFIFPAMGVVLAGPAALKMIEALQNTPGLN